jgi:hypothetical protein
MRDSKDENEMYARTLISPSWRMRGRVAIDAMISTGVRTIRAADGREEGKDGGMVVVKSQPGGPQS